MPMPGTPQGSGNARGENRCGRGREAQCLTRCNAPAYSDALRIRRDAGQRLPDYALLSGPAHRVDFEVAAVLRRTGFAGAPCSAAAIRAMLLTQALRCSRLDLDARQWYYNTTQQGEPSMPTDSVIWDIDDDPDGNVQHCAEHAVTKEEVEEV